MGFSNNSDYFGDWYGKGQIDFNAIINPDDEGDVWMVKMWSGSGYVLDVYLCKAHDYDEAMDIVFNWSYDNEGANKIVFDYGYLINECQENFEKYPDYFGPDLSDDYEEFEMRWFEDYVSSENYDLYARSENFFVGKVPDEYLTNSRKPVKSGYYDNPDRILIGLDINIYTDMFEENYREITGADFDWSKDGDVWNEASRELELLIERVFIKKFGNAIEEYHDDDTYVVTFWGDKNDPDDIKMLEEIQRTADDAWTDNGRMECVLRDEQYIGGGKIDSFCNKWGDMGNAILTGLDVTVDFPKEFDLDYKESYYPDPDTNREELEKTLRKEFPASVVNQILNYVAMGYTVDNAIEKLGY